MILRIKGADGNWYGIPAIKGDTGPQGPQGKPGLGGERGLAFYRVKSDLVSSMEPYPFSSFGIPEDFIPQPYDLVLYNDGNLGYIYSADAELKYAQVAQVIDGTLKGADGYSPTVSVSKVDGVATISITDKNGTKTVKLYDGAGGGNGVPDMAQNDPNGAGYIKNRTHYKEEIPSGVVIDTTTVYYPDNGYSVTIDVPAGIFFAGVRYTVSWFNNPYELVCYENNDGSPTLGNGYLSDSSLPDTGEPFCLVNPQGGSSLIVYRKLANQPNNILKVESEGKTIYHQLDPRFMKDMYYEEEVGGLMEILPETAYEVDDGSGEFFILTDLGLVAGNTYIVKWNGVEYTCVGQDFLMDFDEDGIAETATGVALGNVGLVNGGSDTGEPFMIVNFLPEFASQVRVAGMGYALDGTTSGTYSVLSEGTKTVIHPIDPKFIKDMYYEEAFEEKEILPETVLPSVENTLEGVVLHLKVGYPYTVIYNGESYSCVGKSATIYDHTITYIGDGNSIGGENTDDPFTVFSLLGSTTVSCYGNGATIHIIEGGTLIREMPAKFLPEIPAEKLPPIVVSASDINGVLSQGQIPEITIGKLESKIRYYLSGVLRTSLTDFAPFGIPNFSSEVKEIVTTSNPFDVDPIAASSILYEDADGSYITFRNVVFYQSDHDEMAGGRGTTYHAIVWGEECPIILVMNKRRLNSNELAFRTYAHKLTPTEVTT